MNLRLVVLRSTAIWLARALALACFVAAIEQSRRGLHGIDELDAWEVRADALIAAGNDFLCGFIPAGMVHRIRIAWLRAALLVVAGVLLVAPSRRTLGWALAVAGMCLMAFGTTYGLRPYPSFNPEPKMLLLACATGLASVVAAPTTDSVSRRGRTAWRIVLGSVLAGFSALCPAPRRTQMTALRSRSFSPRLPLPCSCRRWAFAAAFDLIGCSAAFRYLLWQGCLSSRSTVCDKPAGDAPSVTSPPLDRVALGIPPLVVEEEYLLSDRADPALIRRALEGLASFQLGLRELDALRRNLGVG